MSHANNYYAVIPVKANRNGTIFTNLKRLHIAMPGFTLMGHDGCCSYITIARHFTLYDQASITFVDVNFCMCAIYKLPVNAPNFVSLPGPRLSDLQSAT
jgi:hypothetical protein